MADYLYRPSHRKRGLKSFVCFRFLSFFLLAAFLLPLLFLPQPALAAKGVTVTLPDFPVTLNGRRINNAERSYPLICYKNITYFPLTWQDSRFMGLVTSWSEETGLVVSQVSDEPLKIYAEEQRSLKNPSAGQAKIVEGLVNINGQTVDNTKEPYPLLSFRDVIYFPLTWRFAAEEFGWDYQFDTDTGLSIRGNSASGAITVYDLELPLYRTDLFPGSAVVCQDKVFFAGPEKRDISLASLEHPQDTKGIYQQPDMDVLGFPDLYSKNGQAYLRFLAGYSVVTSSNRIFQLNTDGTLEELNSTIPFEEAGFTLKLIANSVPYTKNLFIKADGEEEFRTFGPPYLYFGPDAYLFDGGVYVLANPEGENYPEIFTGPGLEMSYPYRIDLETEEAEKVLDQDLSCLNIQNGYLFYLDEEGCLSRLNLKTKEIQRLWEEKAEEFFLNGLLLLRLAENRYLVLTEDGSLVGEVTAGEDQMVLCQEDSVILIRDKK